MLHANGQYIYVYIFYIAQSCINTYLTSDAYYLLWYADFFEVSSTPMALHAYQYHPYWILEAAQSYACTDRY